MPAKNSANVLAVARCIARVYHDPEGKLVASGKPAMILKVRGLIARAGGYTRSMAARPVQVMFGTRMRELRIARALSQESLAHLVGLDRSYIGSVERGERNVSLINICHIARALGVEPNEMLQFEKKRA